MNVDNLYLVYIKQKTQNVIYESVNLQKVLEIQNMTVGFCNFSRQKLKMTQMHTVGNYVETVDFLDVVRNSKIHACQWQNAINPAGK